MKGSIAITLLFSFFITLLNCTRNTSNSFNKISYQPTPVTLQESERVPKMIIPADNPLTAEGIELGRQLFFDPILSIDSTFSCASCHLPERAFSDGKRVAIGIRMRRGRRNSPSLVNVGYYYKGLFWDGRVLTLEEQSLHPVVDSVEMGHTWERLEQILQKHPDYPVLFRKAFGIEHKKQITRDLVGKALAQFQRTLISKNSKFDQVQRGEAQFTDAERRGFTIFFDTSSVMAMAECSHCHMDPLFTTLAYENNGVQIAKGLDYPDPGRGAVTGNPFDNGKFKVPTLRNIALTAPYMHDGRFRTLEEVIEHYDSGGHPGENVSPTVRPLKLTAQDKADLITFLYTLTDTMSLKMNQFVQ